MWCRCISGYICRFLQQSRASGGRPVLATTHLAGLRRLGAAGAKAAAAAAEAWRRSCGQEGGDSSRRWAARPGRWRRARPGLGDPVGCARLSAEPSSPSRRPAIRPHSARAAEPRAPGARSTRRGPGGGAARLDPSALLPASLRRASCPETPGRSAAVGRVAPGAEMGRAPAALVARPARGQASPAPSPSLPRAQATPPRPP